jgi:hypothetical protein
METRTAAYYIEEGLSAFELLLDERHDFYPAALQLLGQGLEHLLKVTVCLGSLQTKGRLPNLGELKGHDLRVLRDRVVELVQKAPFSTSELAEGLVLGSQCLTTSHVVEVALGWMSDFGQASRYFYLDRLIKLPTNHFDPSVGYHALMEAISEASRELYEDPDGEFSPLQEHLIADRPAAYLKERKEIALFHILGFVSVLAQFCVCFRGDGRQGPLRPLVSLRSLFRLPNRWVE